MRSYKLLEIASQYELYLEEFYKVQKNVDQMSYDELYSLLVEDGFAESDFIHRYLKDFGIESKVVFYNNKVLQSKWGKKGESVSEFELLLAQIKEYSPDVIYVTDHSCFTCAETKIIKDYLSPKKTILVGYHYSYMHEAFLEKALLYDQMYTGDSYYVEYMREQGVHAYLLRHAFEPSLLEKIERKEIENSICFAGSIILFSGQESRIDMLNELSLSKIPYRFYGNIYGDLKENFKEKIKKIVRRRHIDWEKEEKKKKYRKIIPKIEKNSFPSLFGLEYYSALSRYSVCLNMHGVVGDTAILQDAAGNMRMFEATGMGACLLTDYRKGNSEIFDIDNEIVEYKSYEEMIDKAKWLLDNEEEAKKIALAGQKRTLRDYTYKNKAEQMNEYIQLLLK